MDISRIGWESAHQQEADPGMKQNHIPQYQYLQLQQLVDASEYTELTKRLAMANKKQA